ncbi:WD40 repeat-like protein, partial [Polyporus arcularius HHB13444]
FSTDGRCILSVSDGCIVTVWDIFTGERVLSFSGIGHTLSGKITKACFSPNGDYIATGSGPSVRLWRAVDGSCMGVFSEHRAPVSHIIFSRNGETLCSSAQDGSVCIRQMRDI